MTLKWFIRKPYAVKQFGKHSKYPEDADIDALEMVFRSTLLPITEQAFVRGSRPNEYAIPILTAFGSSVVILVKKAKKDKSYDYVVTAVIPAKGLDAWMGRASLPTHRKRKCSRSNGSTTQYYLHYITDSGPHCDVFTVDKISSEIARLVSEGVPREGIKVLQEVPVTKEHKCQCQNA